MKLFCHNHTSRKQTSTNSNEAFCSLCLWTAVDLPLLSTPTVPPEAAILHPPHPVYLSQNTGPQAGDTSPINHCYGTPVLRESQPGLNSHACWADSVCCLQPPSRLNCRALYYSHIIHASLIKAVNSLIVKLENVQHLLSGISVPGIGSGECRCIGGLAKGCTDWLRVAVSSLF